uniref:Ig-like domain-containing protein n=1 Tax=Neogobius melanostomus TaxID=47308 RepID=A0A8C6WJJ3_9GOBI
MRKILSVLFSSQDTHNVRILSPALAFGDSDPGVLMTIGRPPFTVGQNVTLNCSYVNNFRAKLYWFKQSLDNTQTMASSHFDKTEFLNEFTSNRRFSLDIENGRNNLGMTNVQISDSAVYHCICCVAHQLQLLATVHVIVNELNSGLRVDQRESETVELGRSLRLNCSVQFGTCDGRHSVHWFKQSEESAPGVLYSHSDQCEKTTDKSCVYSLPVRNVSSEQTGTYYCAVAACGQVLFGNGTRIEIGKLHFKLETAVDPVVAVLAGALAFTSVLVVLLVYSLCLVKRKLKRQNTGKNQQDNLHYAALSVNAKSRRPRNADQTDCVYSGVR